MAATRDVGQADPRHYLVGPVTHPAVIAEHLAGYFDLKSPRGGLVARAGAARCVSGPGTLPPG